MGPRYGHHFSLLLVHSLGDGWASQRDIDDSAGAMVFRLGGQLPVHEGRLEHISAHNGTARIGLRQLFQPN